MPKYLDYTGLQTFKGKLDEKFGQNLEITYASDKATVELTNKAGSTLDSIDIATAIGKTDTVAGQAGLLSAEDKAKLDALDEHKLFKIVQSLPSKDEADDSTIYLVPNEGTEGDNSYDEYILADGTTWEKIGEYKVDSDTVTTVIKGTDTPGTNKYVEVTTNVTKNNNDYTVSVTVNDDKLKEELNSLLPKTGGKLTGDLTVAGDITAEGSITTSQGVTTANLTVSGKDITPNGDGTKYLSDDGAYKAIDTGVTKIGTLTGEVGLTGGQTVAGTVNLKVNGNNIKAEFVKGTSLTDYGISNAYTKDEVDKKLENKANTAEVYLKTETYNQDEVDTKLENYLNVTKGGTVDGTVTATLLKTTTGIIESDSSSLAFGASGITINDGDVQLSIVNTGNGNLYLNDAGSYEDPTAYVEITDSLDSAKAPYIKSSITVAGVTYQALIDNMIYSSSLKRQVAYVANTNAMYTRVYANSTWTDWTGVPIETISNEEITALFN